MTITAWGATMIAFSTVRARRAAQACKGVPRGSSVRIASMAQLVSYTATAVMLMVAFGTFWASITGALPIGAWAEERVLLGLLAVASLVQVGSMEWARWRIGRKPEQVADLGSDQPTIVPLPRREEDE